MILVEAMKSKVNGLMQQAQKINKEVMHENEGLEKIKENLDEHYSIQQGELSKSYENSVKTLMDRRKQLSEILKNSVLEQKNILSKQKNQIQEQIDKALEASEKIGKLSENIENSSYEDFHNTMEILNKQTSELENFINNLQRIELTYMHFHENIVISDKSEIIPNENSNIIPNKKHSQYAPNQEKQKSEIGLSNVKNSGIDGVNDSLEKIVLHEACPNPLEMKKINSTNLQSGIGIKKKPIENKETGSKTFRYGKQSPKVEGNDGVKFFSPESCGNNGFKMEQHKKIFTRPGVTNPFVEESLMAKIGGPGERKIIHETPKNDGTLEKVKENISTTIGENEH